jgi:hypothetical protein
MANQCIYGEWRSVCWRRLCKILMKNYGGCWRSELPNISTKRWQSKPVSPLCRKRLNLSRTNQKTHSRTRRRNRPSFQFLNILHLHADIFDVNAFNIGLQLVELTVPIRPFLSGEAFEPETIREMSLALESVCETLGLKVVDDAATRLVAEKIIELSQHGVRGIATLHAMTVKEFKTE